jgi:hypothetical protein
MLGETQRLEIAMSNKRPGRPRNEKPSVRLRLGDGNIQLGQDSEMDRLYERIQSLPHGTKFRTVAMWLLTGAMLENAMPSEDVVGMRKAAEDIIANLVVDL